MIKIQVTAFNNVPPPQALVAEFDERGGSIGRAVGNAISLDDPERHISRTHATVQYRGGEYVIRDLGTATPVYVNGQALGNGHEAPIYSGDEIRIGNYVMRVADSDGTLISTHVRAPVGAPVKNYDQGAQSGRYGDDDPFADLLGPAVKSPGKSPLDLGSRSGVKPSSKSGSKSAGLIPDDFDPFAEPNSPVRSEEEIPDDLGLALGPRAAEPGIDQLFDLESGGGQLDPLGIQQGPIAPTSGSDAHSSLDPMVALGLTPAIKPVEPPPQRDDTPELNRAFRPPDAHPAVSASTRTNAFTTGLSQRSPVGEVSGSRESEETGSDQFGMTLSWENQNVEDDGENFTTRRVPSPKKQKLRPTSAADQTSNEPAATTATPAGRRGGVSPASEEPSYQASGAPATPSASRPVGSPGASASVSSDELLRAFLAGAGMSDLEISGGLTPGMMTRIGELLREATQGTLDLLLARALTKREVRADMTMISVRDNNHLKFSPNVEAALAQLLAPPARGFMPPVRAMRDAYDDLRAHQFGFMAGMRAALSGVLERLDPKQLEPRLKQTSVIDSLLPINRKAKLWDLFSEYYKDIAEEAEEDFHALFGKEFLRAYQEQVAKIAQEESNKQK